MERRGQPDSPDPEIIVNAEDLKDSDADGADSDVDMPFADRSRSESETDADELVERVTAGVGTMPDEDRIAKDPSESLEPVSEKSFPEPTPIPSLEDPEPVSSPAPMLSLPLDGLELTPGVTAALKRMLEAKNKKDALITKIKSLMEWDTVGDEVKSLVPEDFLHSLADWSMDHNEPEIIQQCIAEQNKKENEFHKKRDDFLAEQHKELTVLRKRHNEALANCDHQNTPHRKPIVARQCEEEVNKVAARQKEDLLTLDRKIVAAIDSLLTVQQRRFAEYGIPGMKESMDPDDILRQMVVIDVVAKLAGIDVVVIPAT